MTNRTVRDRLLASTIIAGALVAAAPGFAQSTGTTTGQTSTPSGQQTQDSAGPVEPDSSGEIVVTGSLIKNPALTSVNPVQVLGQEELQLRQTNTAEEVLRDLPGAVADIGSAVNNGNGGFANVDLRGLGSNRNLVLLDGNRIVPADFAGVVDLNNIPLAIVQRTEVLTGGASTTYGADAIAGVVNFITRSDFSGAEVNVSKQITGQGDGAYYRADVTVGANFDDGKGNAVISLGYQHSDPVYQGDRGFAVNNIGSFSGLAGGSGTTLPSTFSLAGFSTRQINPATGQLVARYSFPGGEAFNFNPYNIFQTPFQRFNIYGAGHYDITDDITVYTRGMYAKNSVDTIIAPSGAFGISVVIPYDNPYLPVAARNQFCAANGIATPALCAAAAAAGRTFTTTFSRRTTEVGPRTSDFTTQNFDYRAGIRGNITSSLHFDVNGSYGESAQLQTIGGYTLNSRFRDALLADNATTCRSGNAGCVPVNIFGAAGSITPAMVSYLTATSTTQTRTSLGQARAVISGDFGYHSPFASDAINFAFGAEYRKYRAFQDSDTLAKSGDLGGAGGAVPQVAGGYDVTEGFGEIIAPIVQDRPFFKSLQLTGGIRYSHYSVETAGSPTFNTTTYKGGASWEPTDFLKIRGVYQHSARAPNIGELFSPQNIGLTSLAVDPCAGAAPTLNANLRAICLAQGAPAASIGLINQPSAAQVNEISGGNPSLKPERSNSYTAGIVIQPKRIVPGLAITADYYHILINGAVSSPTVGDVIAACFGNNIATPPANAGSAACTSIRRNPDTGDLSGDNVNGLPFAISNLGTILTDGIDLSVAYRRDLGFAILNLSFQGNWTNRNIFKATPTTTPDTECVGRYGPNCGSILPKFYWNQRTTITYHDLDVSLLWRHIDRERYELGADQAFGNFGRIKAYNYFDLSGRVNAGEHVEFTVTVQNLLDKKPPLVGSTIGSTTFNSGNTYPSTYDALGRRFAVGARLKF